MAKALRHPPQMSEESPEGVALKLFRIVVALEGRAKTSGFAKGGAGVDRKYILDTYAECLATVKGYRQAQITSE